MCETFRETCDNIYGLDLDDYYTAPGLSWDAFLKHTYEQWKIKYNEEFEIGLITYMEIYLFVESGIESNIETLCKSE